ncbi:MAG: PDZ domain-containing protein [Acidobacteriota bacterium]|nr:PDZ domain-containing protein [Acidobacteriota bacterium]MDE2921775.1 PDZ domain-containing protein [Acidobacteriota bacterium]MDE3266693.1 PDZ domain-containing protein [Acidobacteriota bacterium]
MTTSSFRVPGLPSRLTFVTILATIATAGLGSAALAQEREEQERSVRVMVLGDGQVEVVEDGKDVQALAVKLAASAQEKAQVFQKLADGVRPTLALHWGGAYLGVELVNLNEPLRTHFGVPEGSGVMVSNVMEDSPASRAGVQVGDILTRFDGEDVTSSRKLTSMVRKAEAGDPADMEIWRDGKVETVSTTLDERPRPDLQANSFYFFRGREDLDGDGEVDVFVSPENVHEKIQEYFDGDEWKERHEHLQRFLHERRPDMKALEDRLESLKERLAELEQRLEQRRSENEK